MTMRQYRQGFAFAGWFLLLLLIVGARSPGLAGSAPMPAVNATDGVGVKGYDAVAYFVNGRPTKGTEQYSYVWKDVSYRFASQENLNSFRADPEKYIPQYGGYCSYAMSLNRIADIDPSRWAVVDGKLYLNNGYLAQSLWSLNKRGNIDSADQNWPNYPKQLEGK